jgi:hypothetical protein
LLTKFTDSFEYSWRIAKKLSARPDAGMFLSVDLIIHSSQEAREMHDQGYRPIQNPGHGIPTPNRSFGRAVDFLARMAKTEYVEARQTQIGIKLIISLQAGYVLRSDFLLERLAFCETCDFAESFLDLAQHISAYNPKTDHGDNSNKLLDYAVGAVVIKTPVSDSLTDTMEAMDEVLSQRLHSPWLVLNHSVQPATPWQN